MALVLEEVAVVVEGLEAALAAVGLLAGARVRAPVLDQVAVGDEALPAVARVRPLPGVHLNVLLQVAVIVEALVAHVALEALPGAVLAQVHAQVRLPFERLAAHVTLERSLRVVNAEMVQQVALAEEPFLAHLALVGLLVVPLHVRDQNRFQSERLAAHVTLERALRAVHAGVPRQVILADEPFLAHSALVGLLVGGGADVRVEAAPLIEALLAGAALEVEGLVVRQCRCFRL